MNRTSWIYNEQMCSLYTSLFIHLVFFFIFYLFIIFFFVGFVIFQFRKDFVLVCSGNIFLSFFSVSYTVFSMCVCIHFFFFYSHLWFVYGIYFFSCVCLSLCFFFQSKILVFIFFSFRKKKSIYFGWMMFIVCRIQVVDKKKHNNNNTHTETAGAYCILFSNIHTYVHQSVYSLALSS